MYLESPKRSMKRWGLETMMYVRNTSRVVFNGRCAGLSRRHTHRWFTTRKPFASWLTGSELRTGAVPCGSPVLSARQAMTWHGSDQRLDSSLSESNVGRRRPHRLRRRLNECIIRAATLARLVYLHHRYVQLGVYRHHHHHQLTLLLLLLLVIFLGHSPIVG